MIKNIRCIDKNGINHYDRGKKGNKVSLIVTSKGIPIGLTFDKSNVHDIHLVIENVENIRIKILGSRLIGDNGYTSKN